MRKLFLIPIIVFLLSSHAYAMDGAQILLASLDDSKRIALFAPMAQIATDGASSCPSYYASTILSWDGDHATSILTTCDSNGNEVTLTDSGSDISTYGEGSSNAMKCDDASELVTYTQTAQQYLDETAAQTICLKVYNSCTTRFDNDTKYFRAREAVGPDDFFEMNNTQATPTLQCIWDTQAAAQEIANGGPVVNNTWHVIGYSWNQSGGVHSANPGDQGTWDDGWEEDNDSIGTFTDDLTVLQFGTVSGDPGDTEYYLIDEFAIVSGYEFDCSTLF